jgi:predicted ATPase
MATMSAVVRVRVQNFKSIAACDVRLGPLTVLVGRNGTGKSNFVDVLRFVRDALADTLEGALRARGGVDRVRRMSKTKPRNFGIRLTVNLPDGVVGNYAFKIAAESDGGFAVQREECSLTSEEPLIAARQASFRVEEGRLRSSSHSISAVIEKDRLALVRVSDMPEFRPLYDSLREMSFHVLDPARMRDLQSPDPGHALAPDGHNVAAVIRKLQRADDGQAIDRINEHLRAVVPGTVGVSCVDLGPKETLQFEQEGKPKPLFAASMSDGTVRALGVLVALFQPLASNGARRPSLVAIEEPEVAIHPGAVRVLGDALLAASDRVQVLVTTHSPDLLDHEAFDDATIRSVEMQAGSTKIGELAESERTAIRERLFTAGELLRQDQLKPDPATADIEPEQLMLFDAPADA